MIGEIHIVDNRLVPNSRRDDFEDNDLRDQLYESFVREVGIPYSRKIRKLSTDRSKQKMIEDSNLIIRRARKIIEGGYVAQAQKRDIVIKLKELTNMKQIATTGSEFESLIDRVKFSDHALTKRNGLLPDGSRLLLKRVLETIYSEVESKVEAEELIDKILGQLVRSATPQH
jgi:molecular chaperone HtpG